MSTNFISHLDDLLDVLDDKLQVAFEECGMDAEYYAKRSCPVDTGRLRNSITHEVSGSGAEILMAVGTNVEYAAFVENGTHRQKSKPYIKPSIAEHRAHYESVIKRHLNE